jgi:hypothetical protein
MAGIMNLTDEQVRLFWSRVEVGAPEACWPWRGTALRNGYGQVKLDGKRYLAHRLALALSGKEVPRYMHVLHAPVVCHNRLCCNPGHLRLGTDADNAKDRANDGAAAYQRPGKYAPNAKLGQAGAVLARFLVSLGNPRSTVGRWLGVSRAAISLAVSGQTWPAS